jgi:hypothetical protein
MLRTTSEPPRVAQYALHIEPASVRVESSLEIPDDLPTAILCGIIDSLFRRHASCPLYTSPSINIIRNMLTISLEVEKQEKTKVPKGRAKKRLQVSYF